MRRRNVGRLLGLVCLLVLFGLGWPTGLPPGGRGARAAGASASRQTTACEAPRKTESPARIFAQGEGGEATQDIPFYRTGESGGYVTLTGYCYHGTYPCGNSRYLRAISAQEAYRLGYQPCGNCTPERDVQRSKALPFSADEPTAYLIVEDAFYHGTDTCPSMDLKGNAKGLHWPVLVTLEEAVYLGKEPCKDCF